MGRRKILIDTLKIDQYDMHEWLDENDYKWDTECCQDGGASFRNTHYYLVLFEEAAEVATLLKWGEGCTVDH